MYSNTCTACGKEFVTRFRSLSSRCRPCGASAMWQRRPTRPDAKCPTCGKVFRTARDNNRYCSQPCYDKARFNRVEKVCDICGKRFSVYGIYTNRYTRCSVQCRHARGRDGVCQRCGKSFRFSRTQNRVYCSEVCRRPPIVLPCATCRKGFRPTPSDARNRRFCSFRCYRRFTGETSIEATTRQIIESKGITVEREFGIGKRDVFDFYVPAYNLLIECDGDYWHSQPHIQLRDAAKTQRAIKAGYQVVRFSESTINSKSFPVQLSELLATFTL